VSEGEGEQEEEGDWKGQCVCVCCREGQGFSEGESGWTETSNENEGMVKDEKVGSEDEGKVEREGLIGRV